MRACSFALLMTAVSLCCRSMRFDDNVNYATLLKVHVSDGLHCGLHCFLSLFTEARYAGGGRQSDALNISVHSRGLKCK